MKFRVLLAVIAALLVLSVTAFATEGETLEEGTTSEPVVDESESESGETTETENTGDSGSSGGGSSIINVVVTDPEVLSYLTYDLDETIAGDAGSMADVIVSVFGEYHPKTQTVTEISSDGTVVSYTQYVPGLAGLDYHWIAGVTLFALFLFCLLKLIGGFVK